MILIVRGPIKEKICKQTKLTKSFPKCLPPPVFLSRLKNTLEGYLWSEAPLCVFDHAKCSTTYITTVDIKCYVKYDIHFYKFLVNPITV